MIAKAIYYGLPDIAIALIHLGQNVNETYLGSLPIHLACRFDYPDIVRLLLDKGTGINSSWNLLYGDTPLMFACSRRSHQSVKLLLDKGADVNIRNQRGYTALHDTDATCAELLLQYKANINEKDASGKTPIQTAKDSLLISYLLLKGADPNGFEQQLKLTMTLLRILPRALVYYLCKF